MAKSKSLIIVESPAKIKTLQKFLGDDYIFESSVGHVRDLPERGFGIDVENDFEPEYVVLSDKKTVIQNIKKAAKKCDTVYLSPDPDREGEAIAWHVAALLPENTNIKRVSFNSITKEAVTKALAEPREIDQGLVNAQQARRLLDRIVGYKISPILARRIQKGRRSADGKTVSAGRVQSMALKFVVDREKEIDAFKPVEYWNIEAQLNVSGQDRDFSAYLHSVDGKKVEKEAVEGKDLYLINNEEIANDIVLRIREAKHTITRVTKKEKKRNPVPPFITSTLQQEASRHYGFNASRTMSIAQGLYEGIDLGNDGAEGLITYMRTDSVRVAPEAISEVRQMIEATYGKEFLVSKPRVFASKKSAQDAHEAIRPTHLDLTPDKLRGKLSDEQFKLYQLVWRRFIASQMTPAVYDTVSADVTTDDGLLLRATGSILKFQGFLVLYEEMLDDSEQADEERQLPNLEEGMLPDLKDVLSEQAFTRPPPRFTEASLVKELEKSGVGRPSTYAAIMNKIQNRSYTVKEKQRLKPTELGKVTAQMLETSFAKIMNADFTSAMEDDLEKVAINEQDWKALIRDFWAEFMPLVELAEKEAFVPKVMTELDCPDCGKKLQKIWASSKYFYGCSAYPDCAYTTTLEELNFDKSEFEDDFDWEQACPICEGEMKVRHGRFGYFLGCGTYPKCRGIVNVPKKGEDNIPIEDMPACPAKECPGKILAKRSRFGKIFYSCSTFPECNVIVNELDELATKYPDHERTAYEKKVRAKKKGSAKTKSKIKKPRKPRDLPPSPLSPELSTLLGVKELPRNQVMKKVWEHIKGKELQDESNKRIIKPDPVLAAVLGSEEPIDMFKMTGAITKHILKPS